MDECTSTRNDDKRRDAQELQTNGYECEEWDGIDNDILRVEREMRQETELHLDDSYRRDATIS